MKFYTWENWNSTNEEFEKSELKKMKFHKKRKSKPQMKKLKIRKWRNWESTNVEIEILHMRKLKLHKWRIWKIRIEKKRSSINTSLPQINITPTHLCHFTNKNICQNPKKLERVLIGYISQKKNSRAADPSFRWFGLK